MTSTHLSNSDQPEHDKDIAFERLRKKVSRYTSEADIEFIRNAYEYAFQAHVGQKRSSGEEYIVHPTAVAEILADLELDAVTIAAALLHDVVEDTNVTEEEIVKRFGQEVAGLVDGVTKLE